MPHRKHQNHPPGKDHFHGVIENLRQFSLGGLLLFVLLVAMGMSLFVTARRLRQAEAELAEYRRAYGILKVENPTKLQAIALWTGEPNHWRWRVYFPRGRYDICVATTGIPARGLPTPTTGWNEDLADIVEISAAAYQRSKDGVWSYAISLDHSHDGIAEHEGMSVTSTGDAVLDSVDSVVPRNGPVNVSPDGPLVLLRGRALFSGGNSMNPVNGDDGLMLWIRRTGNWRGDNSSHGWSGYDGSGEKVYKK
jgi:hypothetical protein